MVIVKRLIVACVAMVPVMGCSPRSGEGEKQLLIFCGAASKPAMEEIASRFERERGVKVHIIMGGSGSLLSQMELSRKGDIYVPGSPDYIITGERKNLLVKGSSRTVAYLVPAIITPSGNPADIRSLGDLAKPGVRVAIGNPETVCLGLYAIEILEKSGLLEKVMRNVVTFGASCSKTANLPTLRNVDAILGWRVFHFWNPGRMDYVPISPGLIPRISHINISIPVFARDTGLSKEFIDFVLSPKGRAIYEKHGYIVSRGKALEFSPRADIGGEYKLPPEYFEMLKNRIYE